MSAFAVCIVPGEHSEVFREVAEGVHHALRALGHDSELLRSTGQLELQGRRSIVLGWNILSPANLPPKDAILYNLEQATSHWLDPWRVSAVRHYAWWDWSVASCERLRELGIHATLVPVGYVPELTRIAPAPVQDIDVLFYGSLNERRRATLLALARRGLVVEHLFGMYGAERDRVIARSKVVLNMHYYERACLEIVRVSYLLANRCAVVSERGTGIDDHEFEEGIVFARFDDLVDRCHDLVHDELERHRVADRGFAIMARRSQAASLRSALRHL